MDTAKMTDYTSTVCFTGHRPNKLAGYDEKSYNAFVDDLTELIERLYASGYRRFITGLAQGVDQLVFWAVMRAKKKHPDIRNVVYMPFRGQERRWAAKGLFSQDDYAKILRHADEVKVLEENAPTDFHGAASLLMKRNEAMCNDSSLLVAVCNSVTWRKDKGGTAACMRYWDSTKDAQFLICVPYTDNDGTLRLREPVYSM